MNKSDCLPHEADTSVLKTSNFENGNIQLKVQQKSGCKVVFEITTLPQATKAAQYSAYKNVAKAVNVPGFRQGKAPESLIRDKYKNALESEFKDTLIRLAVQEAMLLAKLRPLTKDGGINLIKYDPINETSQLVVVEFESAPDVPKVVPSDLTLKTIEVDVVKESDRQNRIENLRLHNATWDDITDRPVQEGDFVVLNIDDITESTPRILHHNSRFQVKPKKMPEWARNLVIGMNIGDTREGMSEPEDEEPSFDFKPRKCQFHVTKIQVAHLPELNDELAKKAGVNTVDELQTQITKTLEQDALQKNRQQLRLAMKQNLLAAYPFDLPSKQIENLHHECHDTAEAERDQFASDEECHAYAHEMFHKAIDTIRMSYLIPSIIREYKIPIPTAHDVQQRATEYFISRYLAGETQQSEEMIERYRHMAENEIIVERALDYLIDHAKRT